MENLDTNCCEIQQVQKKSNLFPICCDGQTKNCVSESGFV